MTNADIWALFISFFSPHAVAVVSHANWQWYSRFMVAIVVAAIVGIGTSFFAGNFGGANLGRTILIAAAVTMGSYEKVWKDSDPLNYFLNHVNGGQQAPD